ncbi:Oligosaccharyl transferase STT3 subunit-domain-containing protein [Dunaliella salina]|uniref:dolichyl-diphosphooligosaccharide--protein glycotransferase n=1 Tax=Dunaliella salina TaxID=3046 RepID=A0ABQ7G4E2_DUNSA|nr:Oligosaccharyl transferase STT3 subunit-domain-containing protein [Dunaliella salina]|eukprot:KAF5829471.1 Oligosaccharyl transferase STT3 subunit-domain-containing protein [Dunaliella salina]
MVAYQFGCLLKDKRTGLVAAALMSIVPGYISRSVAGSYDNEAVAIFALITTFYLWVRAVHLGTMASAVLCAFAYLYMGASWGAYIFISNLIPLYVLVMFCLSRYSRRLYTAYTTLWVVGTMLAMQIRFIGFNHIVSNELLAWNGIFLALQAYELLRFVRTKLGAKMFTKFLSLAAYAVALCGVSMLVLLVLVGRLNPWTGRFLTLLDPTYAKKFIPIVASVSEHQPTTWASYAFDLHLLVFAAPAGMYYCFKRLTDENIFLLTFALTAIYFSGIMVRLMLVAAPAFVLLGAIGISNLLHAYASDVRADSDAAAGDSAGGAAKEETKVASKRASSGKKANKVAAETGPLPNSRPFALGVLAIIFLGLRSYANHCQWVTSEAYSSPSIVLMSGSGPNRMILDDFREAYYWLRHNTKPDAKVLSWWDYGYQITAMGNRSVIVDNNTWNNTHIATVGRTMASNETEAQKLMHYLDADYALVIFGGMSGYQSDDINKFLWMVRISGGVFPEHISEKDYLAGGREYTVGPRGTPTMLNSIMYKMCYHGFGGLMTAHGQPPGFDRVRHTDIGNKDFELEHLEEAFTSEHWIVRIYRVKPLENRF